MNKDSLAKVASDIVASNRGILAADESTPTMGKRLAMIDQDNTEENRRDFRQALMIWGEASVYFPLLISYISDLKRSNKKELNKHINTNSLEEN